MTGPRVIGTHRRTRPDDPHPYRERSVSDVAAAIGRPDLAGARLLQHVRQDPGYGLGATGGLEPFALMFDEPGFELGGEAQADYALEHGGGFRAEYTHTTSSRREDPPGRPPRPPCPAAPDLEFPVG